MNFALKNRAAMAAGHGAYARAPGSTRASGADPFATVSPYMGPSLPTTGYYTNVPDAPVTATPYVAPVVPYVAPEQQWIAGVPNVVTGLTAIAVAYAVYLGVTGAPRKNPRPQSLAALIRHDKLGMKFPYVAGWQKGSESEMYAHGGDFRGTAYAAHVEAKRHPDREYYVYSRDKDSFYEVSTGRWVVL